MPSVEDSFFKFIFHPVTSTSLNSITTFFIILPPPHVKQSSFEIVWNSNTIFVIIYPISIISTRIILIIINHFTFTMLTISPFSRVSILVLVNNLTSDKITIFPITRKFFILTILLVFVVCERTLTMFQPLFPFSLILTRKRK